MTVLKHPVVVIAGPTASGKSGLALDLAEALNGVVINADSMQIYQDTPIISAVPSAADKARVPHRLYEIFPADVNGSVVDWLEQAVAEIKSAWGQNLLPIVVGGTGLYIDNLINGTTPIPKTAEHIRAEVADILAQKGVQYLHDCLAKVDAPSAKRLNPNDTTRVRRAYEVWLDTSVPLSKWHEQPMLKRLPEAEFKVIKILPPQAQLDERCALRFDQMMAKGALDEAQYMNKLHLNPKLPAMRALGLPELIDYLNGKTDRQYAKRQRTWFKHKLQADIVLNECYQGGLELEKLKI